MSGRHAASQSEHRSSDLPVDPMATLLADITPAPMRSEQAYTPSTELPPYRRPSALGMALWFGASALGGMVVGALLALGIVSAAR